MNRITLVNRGHTIEGLPGEALLDTLQRLGYGLRISCRNGVCQICEVELLQGEVKQRYPDNHPNLKASDPSVTIYACTAVPQSDISVKIEGLQCPGELSVKKLSCGITATEKLNSDVYRVRIKLPATASLAAEFYAGQYLDLILPDGRQASFSIGSAPEQGRDLELHIRHVPESEMSTAIVNHLLTSDSVEVELPKGNCFLQAHKIDPDIRFIIAAASTGFAQVKSVVEHLLANQCGNQLHIYWGARVEEDMYLEKLPQQWAAEHPNVHFEPVVSEPEKSPGWRGRTGLLPAAILEDFPDFDDVEIFTSGSPAMVYALLDACEARGFDGAKMHSDVFAYAPRVK